MKRNVFVNLILAFCLVVLSSCVNIIEPKADKNFEVAIGEENARNITSTIIKNHKVTEDSELTVICKVIGIKNKSQEKKVLLKDLASVVFNFDSVIFGKNYVVNIDFYLDDILLFTGESDKFELSMDNMEVALTLVLRKVPGLIKYEFNGGNFSEGQLFKNDYFIDLTYDIPEPKRAGAKFLGWYLNEDFSGEKITSLGTNNYFGDVTLYAGWFVVSEISEVKSESYDGKVKLMWTNPVDENIKEIVISCDDPKVPSQKVDVKNNTATFTALENKKKYTFTLQAVDIVNGVSKGVQKESFAISNTDLAPLTENVKSIASGTDGTAGTTGTYVYFGDYPQTIKAPDVIVSDNTVKVNGFDCCYGIDGHYYVKRTGELFKYAEHHNDPAFPDSLYRFTNNEIIEEGKEYYYKVEPIKWRIVTNTYKDGGFIAGKQQVTGKLLVVENTIDSVPFYVGTGIARNIDGTVVENNNYQYSYIRAYLNGYDGSSYNVENLTGKGFINDAFTSSAQNLINKVTPDNTLETSRNIGDTNWVEHKYFCNPTTDKIFLLSQEETTNTDYFKENWLSYDSFSRFRKTTDFARGTGASSNMYNEHHDKNNGDWWLRSPLYNNSNRARYIGAHGRANRGNPCQGANGGLVPAIVIEGSTESDKTAPAAISNLQFTTNNQTVKFTWDRPAERDVAKIEIICKEAPDKKITCGRLESSGEITGLTNGKTYTFTAKIYDASNNSSAEITKSVDLYLKTEGAVNLKVGTNGSAGTSGQYVLFGDYPQTYVKDAPVGTDKVVIGGIDYYYGTDGHYYVKAKAEPYSSTSSGKNFGDTLNTEIVRGSYYWFKVEPVKWRVIANTYGGATGKVLLAENVLVNSHFKNAKGAGTNVYSSSDLKAFITGNMFNQLFSSTAQGNILQVNDTGAGLTNEKIFILSKDDALNTAYGFETAETANTARSRLTTDYSRASGAYSDSSTKNGSWWLRTSAVDDYVCIVGSVGGTGNSEVVNNTSGGVVPAIVVNSAAFVAP